MLKKIKINTLLNIVLVVIMLTYTYSWMVTVPSSGEIINYNRDLIIASAGVDVDIYIYEEGINDYVLYKEEEIVINNMAPNDTVRFKFMLKNTNNVAVVTNIIFTNIYGDIDALESYISFENSSPEIFTKNLIDDISKSTMPNGSEEINYIKYYDDFKVESNSEEVIYWSIKLDKSASNTIVDKTLKIENIVFLNS